MELLTQYGPLGVLTVVVYVLARIIERQLERRRENGNGDRITLHDLRQDIHDLRDSIQPVVTRLALVERDVEHIKRDRA